MTTTLAERVTERMVATGLSNARLAAACGVRPPTAFNWHAGRTKSIKGEPLLKAAKALGVTPEWLATGRGHKFPSEAAVAMVSESPAVSYLPQTSKKDVFTKELLDLFNQLDETSKRECLTLVRGFIAGRGPSQVGGAPAVAG